MRRRGYAALLGFLLLLTGCTGVPDRQADADAITAGLRAMPGVADVTAGYTNDYTAGVAYSATVAFSDDATADQASAVTAMLGRIPTDLPGHGLTFELIAGDDRIELSSSADRADELVTDSIEVAPWFQLHHDLPAAVTWSDGGLPVGIDRAITLRTSGPIETVVERLRRSTVARSTTEWIIEPAAATDTSMILIGALPDEGTTAILTQLVDPQRFTVTFDDRTDPPLQATNSATAAAVETTARTDLDLLRSTGRPITYLLRIGRGSKDAITVAVGGCLRGGTDLQQRLNSEYGDC